jgi:hypothetical protein
MTARGSALAEYVNSRAVGCLVEPGTTNFPSPIVAGKNQLCAADEAAFVDANLPVYDMLSAGTKPPSMLKLLDTSASKGPQTSVVRLSTGDAAISCDNVRMAKYD